MKYSVEMGSYAMTSILNVIKIGAGVQKLRRRQKGNEAFWTYIAF
jgi:hypothetical protein